MFNTPKPYALAVLIAAGTALSSPLFGGGSETDTNTAAATATVDRMVAALARGDVPGVLETYTQDALVVFGPGAALNTPGTLAAGFSELAALNPKMQFSGHKTWVAGDIAVHLTPWSMTGTAPDGTEISDGGFSVAVLRRDADSNWKMQIYLPHAEVMPD